MIQPKGLYLKMKNGDEFTLPIDEPRNTHITFKHDRIQFEEYWEEGYKPFNLRENYFYDEIILWKWL